MPIDPNIAMGVRPVQTPNILANASQASQLQTNMMQNAAIAQEMEGQNALRKWQMSGGDLNAPDAPNQMLKMGVPLKAVQSFVKTGLEQRKLSGDVTKQDLDITQRIMGDLANNPSNENITANIQDLVQAKRISPTQAQSLLTQALQIPVDRRAGLFTKMALDAKTVYQGDISKRGQDLTDARARENLAKPVFSAEFGGFVAPPSKNAPQGSFTPLVDASGSPVQSNKPLTESQAKGVGFALRAKEADSVINTVGKKGEVQPGLIKRTLESTPFIGEGLGTMANITQSPEQQKIEQAQRNFVNAVLRQESGAVINEDEFNNAKKQYFPQPGDSDDVIKQKAAARKTTIKALETQAGPGLKRTTSKQDDPLGIR